MNLYQTLNQELRNDRVKKLIEAEEAPVVEEPVVKEVKPKVVEEVTPETTEAPAETEVLTESEEADIAAAIETEEKVKELDNRLLSIEDALATASKDEVKALEDEKASILNQLDEIEEGLKTESSKEEITEEAIEEPTENTDEPEEDEEVTVESLLDEIATACDSEEGCDCEKVKELVAKAKELLNPVTEEVDEEPVTEDTEEVEQEELTECEVSSFTVVRKAPSQNVYMIEAQTTEGVKYITGRNYDEESKTLEEAEIADNKGAAANRFKDLLANK